MKSELEWLRELEQRVQKLYRTHTMLDSTYEEVNSIRADINARISEVLEANQRPCNEMGGGTQGIDTADDFAKFCSKPDRHGGLHSFEEEG